MLRPLRFDQVPAPGEALRQTMTGARLDSVSYSYLEPAGPGHGFCDRESLQLNAGVESITLRLRDRAPITITWAIDTERADRPLDGLAVVPVDRGHSGGDDDRLHGESPLAWRPLVGEAISDIALGWTDHGTEDCAETAWSCRVDFGRQSVLIAQGGLGVDDRVIYQPDELVVIFDPAVANAYRPPFPHRSPA